MLKAVPYVELQRGADAVEGVGLTVERRPSAGLQLKALAQPVLVDELLTARRTRDDDLVLGVGLLYQERSREVQHTRRPAELTAQRAGVAHHGPDLLGGPSLAEGGHVERQAERGPSSSYDFHPAVLGLRRAGLAVPQVGGRNLEPRGCGGSPATVGSVACPAPGLEQRGAAIARALGRDQQREQGPHGQHVLRERKRRIR